MSQMLVSFSREKQWNSPVSGRLSVSPSVLLTLISSLTRWISVIPSSSLILRVGWLRDNMLCVRQEYSHSRLCVLQLYLNYYVQTMVAYRSIQSWTYIYVLFTDQGRCPQYIIYTCLIKYTFTLTSVLLLVLCSCVSMSVVCHSFVKVVGFYVMS